MAEPQNQHQQGTQGAPPAAGDGAPAPNPQNPPQDAQGAAGPAAGDQDGDDLDQVTDLSKLRHEAASRRRALRATEKERDGLRERVDRHDRAEVERLVAPSLADASDVWSAADLDALRVRGAVDEAKVGEAVAALLASKPHYARARHTPNLHQGIREPEPERKSFGAALKRDGGR